MNIFLVLESRNIISNNDYSKGIFLVNIDGMYKGQN